MPTSLAFVKDYLALPERSQARLAMEKEWGKANLERFVLKYKEQAYFREKATGDWLGQHTVPCPNCTVGIFFRRSSAIRSREE